MVIAFRLMVRDRLDHRPDCLVHCEALNALVMWMMRLPRRPPLRPLPGIQGAAQQLNAPAERAPAR